MLPRLSVVGVATAEFDRGWVGVLTNPTGVVAHHGAAFVHLFRKHTIFGMEEFGVSAGIDAVDLVVLDPWLELGAQLGAKRQALLFTSEIHQVFARVHHRGTTCG